MRKSDLDYWLALLHHDVKRLGGWVNAHSHLDRADTLEPKFWKHCNIDPMQAATYSLSVKQNLVGYLHQGPAYESRNLYERMRRRLERMIREGTREVVSFIDATPDIGLVAIDEAIKLQAEFRDKISLKIAVSPIFGFKNPKENPDRYEIFREAAAKSDIVGGLPEKDRGEGRIGFDGHIKTVLEMGLEFGREAHLQVDQSNDPNENETEELIQAVRWLGSPKVEGINGPTVWAIHVISPSCYSQENRFWRLVEGLLKYNIGIICCPRAAASMLQRRPLLTPTHNSIARIIEMMEAGVPVRIGTDNIGDIFIPDGSDMKMEMKFAANLARFYSPVVWAKVGAGIPLNEVDKELIRNSMARTKEVWNALGGHK